MEEIIRDMAKRNRTVLFSTHVMQHAERLCERIVLMAGAGRFSIGDGSIAPMPMRKNHSAARTDRDERRHCAHPPAQRGDFIDPGATNGEAKPGGAAHWELQIRENTDPQAILQFCFAKGIRLQSFNQTDPTLHDVFVRLVGPESREASFR